MPILTQKFRHNLKPKKLGTEPHKTARVWYYPRTRLSTHIVTAVPERGGTWIDIYWALG